MLFILYKPLARLLNCYLHCFHHGTSSTVEPLGQGLPLACHVYHSTSIQYTIAKQMIKLEFCTIVLPEMFQIWVKEAVPFRRQNGKMLYVTPSQVVATEYKDYLCQEKLCRLNYFHANGVCKEKGTYIGMSA